MTTTGFVDPAWFRRCGVTAELGEEFLDRIAELSVIEEFDTGEVVFDQGAAGDKVYFVQAGAVEVVRSGRVTADLGPLECFGEMAMFHRSERVATVRAAEPTRLVAIAERRLQPLVVSGDPAAVALVQRLGALALERLGLVDAELGERPDDGRENSDDPALAVIVEEYRHVRRQLLAGWALAYHMIGRPGKLAIASTKPSATAADLSVAYSPGVAEPCVAIAADPAAAYTYTGKGHLVAVVSNGTAVLGLGSIGPLASKPVMEGKAVLFKRFADVDAFDIEVAETDPARLVDTVVAIAPTFGGINLEDIAAPACFEVEAECRRRLDIPVMHDDQHGTAIAAGAALLNAMRITGRDPRTTEVVICGAGAAGLATARFLLRLGIAPAHLILVDVDGVLHTGRRLDSYAAEFATDRPARTLAEAVDGADVFIGLSAGGVLRPEMLASMAPSPIVFAMANPVPEIEPAMARQVRGDVLLATGRSDYPNQVNNVLAFPYVFRGALDIRATAITEQMKEAASAALADLARRPVTDESGVDPHLEFGPEYLIPKPFDRRLLPTVTSAVADAGMREGVAREFLDLDGYRQKLAIEKARIGS